MLTSVDAVYLDSSAIVKLVQEESESPQLRAWLRGQVHVVSSVLARVEVIRAARLGGPAAGLKAIQILDQIDLIDLTKELLERAGFLDPSTLRSLDAIHLAAALAFDGGAVVVTYDRRMETGAQAVGLRVAAPGRA